MIIIDLSKLIRTTSLFHLEVAHNKSYATGFKVHIHSAGGKVPWPPPPTALRFDVDVLAFFYILAMVLATLSKNWAFFQSWSHCPLVHLMSLLPGVDAINLFTTVIYECS
jgi:hypothetical protein